MESLMSEYDRGHLSHHSFRRTLALSLRLYLETKGIYNKITKKRVLEILGWTESSEEFNKYT